MFTGIVEEVGRIIRIEQRGENRRITVAAEGVPKELHTGNSVSVSGVCLTALDIKPGSFCADLAPETWIDGVGQLIAFERIADSENWWLHIELPEEVEKYTVYKGSISIEGISLTVAQLENHRCTIAIIPHTVEMTNLHSLKPGDPVNLEADLIAKYVEKMMKGDAGRSLTIEELVEQGF